MTLFILIVALICLYAVAIMSVGYYYGGFSWFMFGYAFTNIFGIASMLMVLVGMHSGDHVLTLYSGLGGGVLGTIHAIRDLITQAWDR